MKTWLTIILVLACLRPLAAAGETTPEEVLTRVQTLYDKAGGFQARFHQVSRLKGSPSDSAAGWMYFKKPCRMRWQYETPPEQKKEIVSDGRLVWTRVHREVFRDHPEVFDLRNPGKIFMQAYADFIAEKNEYLGSAGQLEDVREYLSK